MMHYINKDEKIVGLVNDNQILIWKVEELV